MMDDVRKKLEISKVLKGFQEHYITDPHPRPTSAPPELFYLSKENILALNPSIYMKTNFEDNDKTLIHNDNPSSPSQQEDNLAQYMASNKFSHFIHDESIRRLLEINNLNSHVFNNNSEKLNTPIEENKLGINNTNDNLNFSDLPTIPTSTVVTDPDATTNSRTETIDSLFNSFDFTSTMLPINPTNQAHNPLQVDISHDFSSQNNSFVPTNNSNIISSHPKQQNPSHHNLYNTNVNFEYAGMTDTFNSGNTNTSYLVSNHLPFSHHSVHDGLGGTISNTANVPNSSSSQNTLNSFIVDKNNFLSNHLLQHQYQNSSHSQQHQYQNSSHSQQHQYNSEYYHHIQSLENNNNTTKLISSQPNYTQKNSIEEDLFIPQDSNKKNGNNRYTAGNKGNNNYHQKLSQNLPTGNITLTDLVRNDCYQGRILTIAKDQASGRMLQTKLDGRSVEHVNAIFDEVLDHFVELMTDPFANYLCQKLMEVCSSHQLSMIIDKVSPDLVEISLNMHGTRAVQRLIDMLSASAQIQKIIQALSNSVVTLVKDLNGNHVIQKCLSILSSDQCNFIYYAMVGHCLEVATHRHGCCVLQRCIDSANPLQKEMLIQEICQQAPRFVQDPYGNYVVQYILNLKEESINGALIEQFAGKIAALSKHKFSSNVVEKCLSVGNPEQQKFIIKEILNGGPDCLKDLLLDPYANYVVQRALNVAKEPEFEKLLTGIKPCLEELHHTPTGAKLVSKLKKKFSAFSSDIPSTAASSVSTILPPSIPRMNNRHTDSQPQQSIDNLSSPPLLPYSQLHSEYSKIFSNQSHHSGQGMGNDISNHMMENSFGVKNTQYIHRPVYPTLSKQTNQTSYGNILTVDKMHPTLYLADHLSHPNHPNIFPQHTPVFSPHSEPFVNPILQPHAYPNHPAFFYSNDIQHPQASNFYSPLHTYISNNEMHFLNSPQIMSIPGGSYSSSNVFSRMSSLNLNTAYPTNSSSAGWG